MENKNLEIRKKARTKTKKNSPNKEKIRESPTPKKIFSQNKKPTNEKT